MKIEELLGKRKKDVHKGDFGRIFILAGSRGLSGAAVLSSEATLRSGAGLTTLGIPASLNSVMEAKSLEVMTLPLPETKNGSLSLKSEKKILNKVNASDIVILGPGLSQDPETTKLIIKIIPKIKKPMVIDADGLNIISKKVDILKKIKHKYIVTPHLGEMSRLIGRKIEFVKKNRLSVAKKFANQYNAVVVLKGSETIVTDGKKNYINKSGNPGMATAGSGDVLTGIIGGFLAQGLKTFDAAKLAVYIHGAAGDSAAKEKTEIALIASDILNKIPEALKHCS